LDDQYSKSNHWSTLKWNMLNQREKLEKESAEKNQNLYKKMKNRSIDHYTHSKNDYKHDSKHDSKSSSKNESRIVENKKNTQNIEVPFRFNCLTEHFSIGSSKETGLFEI